MATFDNVFDGFDADGFGGLHQAAEDGDLARLRKLLDSGVNVDIRDRLNKATALFCAVANNRTDSMKLLIERKAYDVVIPQESYVLEIFSRHRAELPRATRFPFAPDDLLRRVSDKHEVLKRARARALDDRRLFRKAHAAGQLEARPATGGRVAESPN